MFLLYPNYSVIQRNGLQHAQFVSDCCEYRFIMCVGLAISVIERAEIVSARAASTGLFRRARPRRADQQLMALLTLDHLDAAPFLLRHGSVPTYFLEALDHLRRGSVPTQPSTQRAGDRAGATRNSSLWCGLLPILA